MKVSQIFTCLFFALSLVSSSSVYASHRGKPIAVEFVREEGGDNYVYKRNIDGHFYVEGIIDDKRVLFLVDTGATKTILSEVDARRLGISTSSNHYVERYETPNGLISAAPIVLDTMVIGGIELSSVRASVSNMRLKQSILGMNVLSQLNINFFGNSMVLSKLNG